jgi:ethanolamine utilization microcompartment shell protein EutS
MTRKYSSISVETTLAATISNSVTTMTVASGTGSALMGGVTLAPGNTDIFTVAIDVDTQNEEIVYITNVSGDSLTVVRGQAGTSGISHTAGASVKHVMSSADLTYFNNAIQSTIPQPGTPTIDGGTP